MTEQNIRLLRIVTVASERGAYGGPFDTARRQCRIARGFGMTTVLLAGHFADDKPKNTSVADGEVFVPVKRYIQKHGFTLVYSLAILKSILRTVPQAQVVHVSYARELIPFTAAALASILGSKLVLQPHGMLTSSTGAVQKIVDIAVRALYKKASVVIALTETEKTHLESWCPTFRGEYKVLGNPAPGEDRARVRTIDSELRVAFIARLHPRKRVDVFIKAANQLTDLPMVRFQVTGPDGGELPAVLNAASKSPNLEYAGFVSAEQVIEIVDHAEIFVLTSQAEPWGNVLATALQLGVPVILPSSAALANAVDKYGAGIVVPDGDPKTLATTIRELASDTVKYEELSRGALMLSARLLSEASQAENLHGIYSVK